MSLSQCLSVLSADSQRMLLLRAGIGMALPASRDAVAKLFQITPTREAGVEQAGLLQLGAAARAGTCGSPPVWLHVPAADRLVPVAAVFVNALQPTHAVRRVTRGVPG